MKVGILVVFLLINTLIQGQDTSLATAEKNSPYTIEMGISGYLADFAFPNIDLDFMFQLYQQGSSSIALKITPFLLINGNHYVSPNFLSPGILVEMQYRVRTKRGFYFAIETGLGAMGEFFTKPVFTAEHGYRNKAIPYGVYSLAIRIGGYDPKPKLRNLTGSFILGYRMQFPFNTSITHILQIGFGLSFDMRRVGGHS